MRYYRRSGASPLLLAWQIEGFVGAVLKVNDLGAVLDRLGSLSTSGKSPNLLASHSKALFAAGVKAAMIALDTPGETAETVLNMD